MRVPGRCAREQEHWHTILLNSQRTLLLRGGDWLSDVAMQGTQFPVMVCDKDEREIGYLELWHHSSRNADKSLWDVPAGRIVHWGQSLSQANKFSFDPGLTGPYNHDRSGGWYVSLDSGAP